MVRVLETVRSEVTKLTMGELVPLIVKLFNVCAFPTRFAVPVMTTVDEPAVIVPRVRLPATV